MRRRLDCQRYIDQGEVPMHIDHRALHFRLFGSWLPKTYVAGVWSSLLHLGRLTNEEVHSTPFHAMSGIEHEGVNMTQSEPLARLAWFTCPAQGMV